MPKPKKSKSVDIPYLNDEIQGYKGFRYNMRTANNLSFRDLEVVDPVCRIAMPKVGKFGIHFAENPMVPFENYPPMSIEAFNKQPRYAQVTGYGVNKKTYILPCYACKKIVRSNTTMNIVAYVDHIVHRARSKQNEAYQMGLRTYEEFKENYIISDIQCAAIVVRNAPDDNVAITTGSYSLCSCTERAGYHLDNVVTTGACSIAAMTNRHGACYHTRRAIALGANSVAYSSTPEGFAYVEKEHSVAITKCVRSTAVANGYGAVYLCGKEDLGITRDSAKVTGKESVVVMTEHHGSVICRSGTLVIFQMPNGEWEMLTCGCGKFEPYKCYTWRQLVRMIKPNIKFKKGTP